MTLRALVCGALLGLAGACSAADMVYTYTGNVFDQNDITVEPSRLVAHFVFDFDHSPEAAKGIYTIKSWDVSGAGIHFNQATPSVMNGFSFKFDSNMKIVDWFMSGSNSQDWSVFISDSAAFDSNGHAWDMVAPYVMGGSYASVYDKPGVWTVSAAPVPEPSAYLMLIAGLACMAGFGRAVNQIKRKS